MFEHLSNVEYHSDSGHSSILTHSDEAFIAKAPPLMYSSIETAELIHEARAALRIFELPGNNRQVGVHGHWIDVHGLLDAMLIGAKISGGERYTASVIIAASMGQSDGGIKQLADVAQDWLFHLLWPIKKAYKSKEIKYELTTPTPRNSEAFADQSVPKERPRSSHDAIVERDGHRCAEVVVAHILRRAIMSEEGMKTDTLPATLDILTHYADLPKALVSDFTAQLDAAENGMVLDVSLHTSYDRFTFCLLPTEEANKYMVHWFHDMLMNVGTGIREVKFTDHSLYGIPLPNPKFIAIHAAIAHVLHLSGAGRVIDEIIDTFFEDGVVPASRLTDDDDMALRMALLDIGAHQQSLDFMVF
ncbi:hypothetical protein A0H81_12308 [Grifola frondosa]|uniref:Uncharacterized protein n=1 Tax=Grifola frondosa TaxID=5627 RepID=A0A1C7LVC5_GRIFR|nr:hypothetical protein A0H81_12308 [Grifola frondosa]